MAQLVISAALLLAVIAMKFLFPAALDRCRATLLDLLGADTDFVEVFSAAGRAFSDGSTVSDALNDAYTAVFGTSEIPAAPAVSRSETLPDNVEMLQRVLDFDYVDRRGGQITSLFGCRSDPLEGDGRFHYGLDIAGEEGAVIPRLCRRNGDGYWQQHRLGQLRHRHPRRRFFHSLCPLP